LGASVKLRGSTNEVITAEVLNPVFDHDFHITEHEGRSVCLYYDKESGKMRGTS